MTMRTPTNACTTLQNLLDAEADLNQKADDLRSKKSPGTVVFFDLVGSTDYRRRHGSERGARKAYLHNVHVSRAIVKHGGTVVKWMGDGVMGCFTHDKCGEHHANQALKSALAGLKILSEVNCNDVNQNVDDELHSKVSISSGRFHYLNVGELVPQDDGHVGTVLDPIGSEVDLAARMNSLCDMDVILVDSDTFWGRGNDPAPEDAEEDIAILPICKVARDAIPWRELILKEVRETVYLPTTAGFFVNDDGLELCRVGRGATEPVDGQEFCELVKHDAGSNGHAKEFVFCTQPIACNIRGFAKTVDAIAITTAPHANPVKEQVYDWHPKNIKDMEFRAEQAFRQGDIEGALQRFQEILELDPRQFHANTRVAMILRFRKDTKGAMQHLMAAKQSNPTCPLVWGVAGITHLDDYIRDNGDKNECLSKAVTGLSRARHLAEEQFHGLMEQYCTAMLAIALVSRGHCDDKTQAKPLLDKLELWPAKNSTVTIIRRLSSSFLSLVEEKERGNVVLAVEQIIKDAESGQLKPVEESATKVPFDHLISDADIHNLVAKAKYLMELA